MFLPTPYPYAFSISFVTNVTEYDMAVPVSGQLFYDWTLKSQRIDHGRGSFECQHFYQTMLPCSLLFVPGKGMYRIISNDNTGNEINQKRKIRRAHQANTPSTDDKSIDCCLDIPDLGTPPPNWATSLLTPTFDGIVYDTYSNIFTYQWKFDKNITIASPETLKAAKRENSTLATTSLECHTHREVAPINDQSTIVGRPVLFSFPGSSNGTQDYHYDPTSMKIGPQDPVLFQLPTDECYQTLCATSSQMLRN